MSCRLGFKAITAFAPLFTATITSSVMADSLTCQSFRAPSVAGDSSAQYRLPDHSFSCTDRAFLVALSATSTVDTVLSMTWHCSDGDTFKPSQGQQESAAGWFFSGADTASFEVAITGVESNRVVVPDTGKTDGARNILHSVQNLNVEGYDVDSESPGEPLSTVVTLGEDFFNEDPRALQITASRCPRGSYAKGVHVWRVKEETVFEVAAVQLECAEITATCTLPELRDKPVPGARSSEDFAKRNTRDLPSTSTSTKVDVQDAGGRPRSMKIGISMDSWSDIEAQSQADTPANSSRDQGDGSLPQSWEEKSDVQIFIRARKMEQGESNQHGGSFEDTPVIIGLCFGGGLLACGLAAIVVRSCCYRIEKEQPGQIHVDGRAVDEGVEGDEEVILAMPPFHRRKKGHPADERENAKRTAGDTP